MGFNQETGKWDEATLSVMRQRDCYARENEALYLHNAREFLNRLDMLREYITPVCPECGQSVRNMTEDWLALHKTGPGDYVLVGCEGYLVINPALLTGCDEFHPDWSDWTFELEGEIEVREGI